MSNLKTIPFLPCPLLFSVPFSLHSVFLKTVLKIFSTSKNYKSYEIIVNTKY